MTKTMCTRWIKASFLLLSLLCVSQVSAQQVKIKPTSRLLFDAGAFSSKNVELNDGVVVRDFRMGLKAYYGDDFFLKADASFVNNKVSMKDVYLQYNFSDHMLIRGGHFTVPFGLQSAYGTAHKQFMDQPSANVFQMGRRLGIMHALWNNKFWLSYGAFADNKSISESTDKSGSQGYTLAERFVYKPVYTDYSLAQVGFSFSHTHAEAPGENETRFFRYKAPFLTVVDKTNAIDATVDHARYENKFTVEFAGIYRFLALESQYYYSNIKRNDNPSFKSDGFYAVAKGLLINRDNYKYTESVAGLGAPSNKNLELILGYSMVNMNDKKADILGGKMQDISVGLAFYWNKHITFRTNYSYIEVTRGDMPKQKVNALQCRAQYYF